MSNFKIEVSIKDTELFKDVLDITKEFLDDENVPKDIKQKYERKIESVMDKAE